MAAILPVIGKILLIILLVIVALVALLLFFPFTYRAKIRANEEEKKVEGSLSWLFSVLRVSFAVTPGETANGPLATVRLLGIPLFRFPRGAGQKRARKEKRVVRQAKVRPSVIPHSEREKPTGEGPAVEVYRRKEPNWFVRLGAKISAFIGKIKALFSRAREILDFLRSESFAKGTRVLKRQGFAILRHIKPRQITGRLAFGFDDPATTGQLLACIGIAYPVLPKKLCIEPHFDEKTLDADVRIGGHFFGIVLLVRALKIILNKDVKALIGRFKKSQKKARDTAKETLRKAG